MSPEERLNQLGIQIPPPPPPAGAYVPFVRTGNLLFVSGMLPRLGMDPIVTGRLGDVLDVEKGKEACYVAMLNALAVVREAADGLDNVRPVRVAIHMMTTPDFTQHALVADGASNLLNTLYGDAYPHARLVFGAVSLPRDMPVEIETIWEVISENS